MSVNIVLPLFVAAFVFGLFVIEGYTVATGKPTISERIQWLGRSAPLVVIIAAFLAGVLLDHFFG